MSVVNHLLNQPLDKLYATLGINRAHTQCNLSVNSRAKTLLAIRSESHWFDQLKAAEGFIRKHEDSLTFALHELRKKNRELKRRKLLLIKAQKELEGIDDEVERELKKLKIEQLEDDVFAIAHSQAIEEDAYRDCLMEKEVAEAECSRLLQEHEEEIAKGYDYLQAVYTEQALIASHVKKIEAYILSQQTNFPLEVMDCLVSLPPQFRSQVWWQAINSSSRTASELGFLADADDNLKLADADVSNPQYLHGA